MRDPLAVFAAALRQCRIALPPQFHNRALKLGDHVVLRRGHVSPRPARASKHRVTADWRLAAVWRFTNLFGPSVDAITCRLATMLLPDPARALREMLRVIRPNGYVGISC